jgi:hypothetical protein
MKYLCITKKHVAGALAHWAIRQSPFDTPFGLMPVLEEFFLNFEMPGNPLALPGAWYEVTRQELYERLKDWLTNQPVCLLRWNVPRKHWLNPRDAPIFVATSAFSHPSAEGDIIDLDALAGNVANQLREECYEIYGATGSGTVASEEEGPLSSPCLPSLPSGSPLSLKKGEGSGK